MTDAVRITLDGPGKNALSTALMTDALAQIEQAKGAPLLITGAGDVFCSGLDLFEITNHTARGMRAYVRLLERFVTALYRHPAPTAAAVHGHAIAGGCIVALCCDHRVATRAERARIGLNEVAIGVQFPPCVMAIVRRRVPRSSIDTVLLEAALHPPARALQLGLVDALDDDPLAAAAQWLARVGAYDPVAYAATKATLRGELEVRDATLEAYFDAALDGWTSEDFKARVRSILGR